MPPPGHGELRRRACRCGPPPERCIPDDTVMVQYASRAGRFIDGPRTTVEREVSLLFGAHLTREAVFQYVRGEPPTGRDLRRAGFRSATAGALREAGFAVVHTPSKVKDVEHASVCWPADDPLRRQEIPWPPDVSDRFIGCFNECWEP